MVCTIPIHAIAVNAQVVYGFYVKSVGALTGGVMTMDPASTTRASAPWIPAAVGTARAWMGISDEVLVAGTEPARDFGFTWPAVGATSNGVALRITIVPSGVVTTVGGFGFLPTIPGFAST